MLKNIFGKLQQFIELFAHGVIYGAKLDAVGGGQYIGGALF